jgi:hypothetical protein
VALCVLIFFLNLRKKVLDISLFNRPKIQTHQGIENLTFGMTIVDVIDHLGEADQIREITGGELELLYQDTIFRFHNSIFVEGTLPDRGPVIIDQIPVINIFQWLSGLDDVIDRARFLVSLEKGIAYDYRHANSGSITVFQQGHWDGLI